ncbi:MFS nicotinic acid transporter Tna1 [Gigaspora margarita]|uniref:MFS nicotinic acid transporter Tna1 n=1 Tax=Gigaspora margarita TaxID=4874 RepID=A0A8H3XMF3_GIGMA|nr:MFS nicotinic acid transporter Tna1 [Gigaspora margarita]
MATHSVDIFEKKDEIIISSAEEKKLLKKLDLRIIPLLTLLFTLNFLDRSERSYRISLFFSGATIAGAFSGLLAFAIMNLDGKFGLSGWRWIFLIEGLATVTVSFFSYFLITDYAETASWLTEDERKLAVNRLLLDEGHGHTTRFDKFQIFQAFKDLKVYIFMFMYFSAIVGYSILVSENSSIALKYSGACIVGLGTFACVPNLLAWTLNNLSGDLKRAVGCAMAISWGNLGGIVSAQLYRPNDAPTFKFGHSIAISLLIVAVILSIIQYYHLKRMNEYKLKDPIRFFKGINEEDAKHLGDMHPSLVMDSMKTSASPIIEAANGAVNGVNGAPNGVNGAVNGAANGVNGAANEVNGAANGVNDSENGTNGAP